MENYDSNLYKENQELIERLKITNELDEKEMIQIYGELLNVLRKHNTSYLLATEIALSFAYSFLSGAAELSDDDL